MADDAPLSTDLSGSVLHGGPSADDAPLSTDLTGRLGISGAPADTGTGLLDRSWVSLADIGKQTPQAPSQTPVRDLARNAAAATVRGSAAGLDVLTNPSQIPFRLATTGGAAAYDWLAPKVGLPAMSDEQRADLTGVGTQPAERGDIAQIVQGAGSAAGADPYAVIPKTPVEGAVATALEGGIPALALGPLSRLGMIRGGLLGAGGALGGAEASQFVDPKYAPLTEMGTNMLIQGVGGYAAPRTGAGIDPAVADIAQTGRAEGIPFSAPDITPGSRYRTPAQVASTSDALQGNMIRELGFDPNTGDAATAYRITPDLTGQAKTTAGADMRSITNTNNIGTMQTYRLLQQLQTAERQIDTTAGITDADRSQMRSRIGEIRGAINRNTGTMDGTDYQSLTNTDSPLDRLAGNANPDIANIGRGLMTNLDQAFRGSLNADDSAAYTNARYRYRLASTLEPLAEKNQGVSLPSSDVADALYTAQQKYGTIPGSQLDRFQSQARLIAGGPTPYQPSVVRNVLDNPTPMAVSAGTGNVAPLVSQAVGPYLDMALGGAARSPARMSDVTAAALDPLQRNPQLWRLRQALGGAAAATVP